jgi:hypothetical protein
MTKRERHRPQFELDPIMAMALGLYMVDNEILEISPVLRTAVRRFLPVKYIEEARLKLAREKNGTGKRKRK